MHVKERERKRELVCIGYGGEKKEGGKQRPTDWTVLRPQQGVKSNIPDINTECGRIERTVRNDFVIHCFMIELGRPSLPPFPASPAATPVSLLPFSLSFAFDTDTKRSHDGLMIDAHVFFSR